MSGIRYGLWSLYVPTQAIGTGVVYFDLWNGSDRDLTASSVIAIKDGLTAVTGVIAYFLYLTRTTAVGTGGTASTSEGANAAACTISMLQQRALPSGVSARLTPTGGGTAGAIISSRQIFPEETSSANYDPLEFLPAYLTIPEGTGIRISHGAGSIVGNVGFNVIFY